MNNMKNNKKLNTLHKKCEKVFNGHIPMFFMNNISVLQAVSNNKK